MIAGSIISMLLLVIFGQWLFIRELKADIKAADKCADEWRERFFDECATTRRLLIEDSTL